MKKTFLNEGFENIFRELKENFDEDILDEKPVEEIEETIDGVNFEPTPCVEEI